MVATNGTYRRIRQDFSSTETLVLGNSLYLASQGSSDHEVDTREEAKSKGTINRISRGTLSSLWLSISYRKLYNISLNAYQPLEILLL